MTDRLTDRSRLAEEWCMAVAVRGVIRLVYSDNERDRTVSLRVARCPRGVSAPRAETDDPCMSFALNRAEARL